MLDDRCEPTEEHERRPGNILDEEDEEEDQKEKASNGKNGHNEAELSRQEEDDGSSTPPFMTAATGDLFACDSLSPSTNDFPVVSTFSGQNLILLVFFKKIFYHLCALIEPHPPRLLLGVSKRAYVV